MHKSKISAYWYVPNIIGYIRLILLCLALFLFKSLPLVAVLCYIVSSVLDAFDGFFARFLKQSSNFGIVLDYCTDRLTIVVLIAALIITLPKLWVAWVLILGLDLFSHYCQLYFTILSNVSHHKNIKAVKFKSLRLYYNSRLVLFLACLSQELFLATFVLYFLWPKQWMIILFVISIPGFIFKNWVHILQIIQVIQCSVELEKNKPYGK
jgi:CDP-diacylglycerol--inositol 3-phosphatidyltransferase